jgi:hypothetical protein
VQLDRIQRPQYTVVYIAYIYPEMVAVVYRVHGCGVHPGGIPILYTLAIQPLVPHYDRVDK